MNAFSEMNLRERILVAVLGAALIAGGYLFFRGADLNKQVLVLEDRIESVEKKVKKAAKRERKSAGALPELDGKKISANDVRKLTKAIESEKSKLSGFGYSFIDVRDKAKFAKLLSQITLHAQANRLQLLSKVQSEGNLAEMVAAKPSKQGKGDLNRPLYELRLQGGYSALYGFIKQLSQLEYSVIPIKFQISRTDRTALGGGRVLDIEMTLAL
ncbi:hypothetical protein ACMXYV_14380 [Neptuniibacter sp. SY11_33]|uniref:hypothetical protein n=1 Tax=Neptuniibacter sp. SY11_33 TaxID=3398215 RepID=UPI0039F5E93E